MVKRFLPKKTKIGHTGTLDPLASGLLVLLLGRATRLSRYVTGLDKRYTATAFFGATSDTLDAEGDITALDAPLPDKETLRGATRRFTGVLLQTPPMASAVKVGGERLYALHRRGVEIERDPRPVTVHSFHLTSYEPPQATFEVSCTSGTYVRTLVADLAAALNTGAYLTALRRTRVGRLKVEDATHPEKLTENTLHARIIQPVVVVSHLPALRVGEDDRFGVCNGRAVPAWGLEGDVRVECGGELLGVYRGDGVEARPEVVLCGG